MFDILIDILLYIIHGLFVGLPVAIYQGIENGFLWIGRKCGQSVKKYNRSFWIVVFGSIGNFLEFIFETLPEFLSLRYRSQRLFFPYLFEEFPEDMPNYIFDKSEYEIWLNKNVGRHRWRRIYISYSNHHPCFRRKCDAMAFKIWWD